MYVFVKAILTNLVLAVLRSMEIILQHCPIYKALKSFRTGCFSCQEIQLNFVMYLASMERHNGPDFRGNMLNCIITGKDACGTLSTRESTSYERAQGICVSCLRVIFSRLKDTLVRDRCISAAQSI